MNAHTAKILLVEDEEADVVHFQRVCRKQNLSAEIVVARSGDSALELMRADQGGSGRFVIVTDLNMPGLTGHEFIEEVRGDERLASNVIFVLSTSDLADDIDKAYQSHVAGYIVKDPLGERIEAGVAMLQSYLNTVSLG